MTEKILNKENIQENLDEENNHEITQEINLDSNEVNEEVKDIIDNPNENFVESKPITKLNEDEKSLIIKNQLNNVDQPFYEVKQYKNGSFRIIKKKEKKSTITSKVINSEKPQETLNNQKVYYSNDQLLFEHIIELNSKIDKLMNKHKKLKKKYQNLQQDIYVDDEELIEENIQDNDENNQEIQQTQPQNIQTNKQLLRKNWRSRINYL